MRTALALLLAFPLGFAVTVDARAGAREDASALVERAKTARAARNWSAADQLLDEAIAVDPIHPVANTMLAERAELRGKDADCIRHHERAAEGLARDAKSAIDDGERIAHLHRAMACAAGANDDLAAFDALKAKREAARSQVNMAAVDACTRGYIGWEDWGSAWRIHDKLVDRVLLKFSARVEKRFVCGMLPRLRDNLEDGRQSIAVARAVRNCAAEDMGLWEPRLTSAAEELAKGTKIVRDIQTDCDAP